MAYLDDITDEERAQQEELGGSAPSAGGVSGGGAVGSSAPAPSSGFANLSSYFTANRDAATAQGAGLYSDLEGRAKGAVENEDAGEAANVLGQIDAAQTPGGIASVTGNDNGAGYTSGMAGLDGYLSARGGGGDFGGLKDLYGGKLSAVQKGHAAPTAPGAFERKDYDEWRDSGGTDGGTGKATSGAVAGAIPGAQIGGPIGAVVGGMAGAIGSGEVFGGSNPVGDYMSYASGAATDYQQQLRDYVSQLAEYNAYRQSIGKEPIAPPDLPDVDWAQYGYTPAGA